MRDHRSIYFRSGLLIVAWLASLSSVAETWVFVGSNLGLAYNAALPAMNAAEAARATPQLFHNVYINPEAYAHFRATKTFPEPTILVMEVFAAARKEPSGVLSSGAFNGERRGLEVAVKNSARPDGHTTAWAYYDFSDREHPSGIREFAPAFPDQICERLPSAARQHG